MAVVSFDYDNDRRPDIYVANDTNRNFLYRNNGDRTFTDNSLLAGVGYDETGIAEGSMGIDCGDYNQDTLNLLKEIGIDLGFRTSMSIKEIRSPLEIPRDDHANVFKLMQR